MKRLGAGLSFLLSACRAQDAEGGCIACLEFLRSARYGLENVQQKFLRRVKGRSGLLADDNKVGEQEYGAGAYTMFCPFVVDTDGRRR